jgi:RHS repeat-associated protein
MTIQSFLREGLRLQALLSLLLLPGIIEATNIGADPPKHSAARASDTSSVLSTSEGNLMEYVPVSSTRSSNGPTVNVTAVYNSYNADGSRAVVDTVMGYGWTHSYNIFLFTQFGAMFRYGGDGRVTKYGLGPGGTFIAANGYFETLVKTTSTTFTLTQKDKTVYTFALVTGTPFLVAGPVWRLTQIVDRNGNTTTLTYAGGNLTGITDTYGRTTFLAYTAQNKVSTVTDPAGRVTTLQYDSTGHKLTRITDPNGNSIQYSYNSLYQLIAKIDKAGRTFTYSYSVNKPSAVDDSAGASPATLSNPGNWATDPNALAENVTRTYIPATTTVTDGRGNTWRYQYNSNGYPTQTTAPDSTVTSYIYDPSTLMVSSTTDADGHTTSFTYDSEGNELSLTDALGHVTVYTYEPVFNMMTSMTDPRGRLTTYSYDGHGNRIQETDPLGQTRKWTYDSHGNVLSATDKNGNTTTYQYDSFGNQTKTTDPLSNVTTSTYDGVGNMLSRTDPNGHTTSSQYDGMNRLLKMTDALGHFSQILYDGEGNRTQAIDRNGHTTSYQYDLRQRLVKTTDALGDPETYSYDGNDNRVSMIDRNGHTTSYTFDLQNRMSKIADALGDTTTNVYDGVGNTLTTTDGNNHTTTFTYDALNRRATMTDAASELTQYQYDTGTLPSPPCPSCGATPGSSLITGQTDANGKVIYYKYDALNRQIDVVRKVGSTSDTITQADAVTMNTYDPVGNRLTLTEPDGNTKTWTYDADNRVIKEVNAAGDTTMTAYDGVSNVTSTTEPNLNVVTNTYDALNRITHVADSAGLIATYSYDNEGNRLSHGDGNGNTTLYAYDALNRLVTTTDPLVKTTTTAYDAVGNPLQTTDRNGMVTTMAYDAINRRTSTTDALGHTTQSQYDAVGNLTKLTDANSHATQRGWDPVNRQITETYADGTVCSYTYDGVGNVLTRTDQIGQVTHYAYNDLYFLVSRTYPSSEDMFRYDLSGRMLEADRGGYVNFAYDGADRLIVTRQDADFFNCCLGDNQIVYSYNIPGRTRTITYPGGRVITENTDARGRMYYICDSASPYVCQTAPSSPSVPMVEYYYDLGNRVTNRVYFPSLLFSSSGPTVFADFYYNANDWVTILYHLTHGGDGVADSSYTYDNEGNKKYEQKTTDPTQSEAYLYDSTYRLVNYAAGTLSGSTVPSPSTQTSYNLDPVGNWSSKTTNSILQTRVHNSTNELTEINSTALTYDANGNLLNDGTYIYAYDEENRLTQVTQISGPTVVGQYEYDALGRRVQKNDSLYFYDGARLIEEQRADDGFTLSTYVYGNGIDEVLNMNRGVGTFYYHQNALGSVEAITDNTGTPVERYAYDAYGFVTVTDGTGWQTNNPGNTVPSNPSGTPHSAFGNPWMFTGRQLDEESGLYFYRARNYDPGKGRFMQRDPIGYADSTNLYMYVDDNPTNELDPSGMVVGVINNSKTNIKNNLVARPPIPGPYNPFPFPYPWPMPRVPGPYNPFPSLLPDDARVNNELENFARWDPVAGPQPPVSVSKPIEAQGRGIVKHMDSPSPRAIRGPWTGGTGPTNPGNPFPPGSPGSPLGPGCPGRGTPGPVGIEVNITKGWGTWYCSCSELFYDCTVGANWACYATNWWATWVDIFSF